MCCEVRQTAVRRPDFYNWMETQPMKLSRGLAVAGLLSALPGWAMAADIDGSTLSVLWGVPFAGILLSIALMPLLAPIFWHHHFGKVAAAWGLAFLVPFAITFGPGMAGVSLACAGGGVHPVCDPADCA